MKPKLCLIVAVAENGVIGKDNDLPWHLPSDLRHFKERTMGKPVILGRKTYDSIGKPLPGRHFVVLSRDPEFKPEGVSVVQDPAAALQLAEDIAVREGVDEIMVAGGAQLYTLYLDRADLIYRTVVRSAPDGDAKFPKLGDNWSVTSSKEFDERGLQICFQRLEKRL